MNFNDYQNEARKTAIYVEAVSGQGERIAYNALGLAGEAGEVCNKIKKVIRKEGFRGSAQVILHGVETRDAIQEELGDVLWYLAMLAREAGFDLDEDRDQQPREAPEASRSQGVIDFVCTHPAGSLLYGAVCAVLLVAIVNEIRMTLRRGR